MMHLPTLKQLRHLVALAEYAHFGKAAAASHVTQSTLSASIRELEETLGVKLIDRGRRKMALTPSGEEVLSRAQTVLQNTEELVLAAKAAQEPLTGIIRLGVIPTIGPFLLPSLFRRLRRSYPRLCLFLHEEITERLVRLLESGELDLLLLALPCDCGTAETVFICDDPFRLACPREHPLAQAKNIRPEKLKNENLLLLRDGHCLREQALSACRLVNHKNSDPFAATSLHTLVQMVDSRLGITLLPQLALSAGILRGTSLVSRPLQGPGVSRQIGLAWRRGTQRQSEFKLLAAELTALI